LSISPSLLFRLFSVFKMSTVRRVWIFHLSSWKHYDCTIYALIMVFKYILALALKISLQCHKLKQQCPTKQYLTRGETILIFNSDNTMHSDAYQFTLFSGAMM
jgi:hypothetical protein